MKRNPTLFWAMTWALLWLACAAQKPQAKPKGVKRPVDAVSCNMSIMRSYLFKGRKYSSQTTSSLVCPSIRKNCCNRFDEQRAFHIVNELLPPRLIEYREKIKQAFARIRMVRSQILKKRPIFRGPRPRQEFCTREFRKLDEFGFTKFMEQLIRDIEESYVELDDHYASFYCSLCDATNHESFTFRKTNQQIMVDSKFCASFLEGNRDQFEKLNIDLIGLLVNMQHVVDCFHYRESFNMPFFNEGMRKHWEDSGRCINSLGAKAFIVNCKPICDKITYTKVIDIVEGDYEFMTVGVNLMERYLVATESGRMVSNKLRDFFKTITKNDREHPNPLGQIDINFDTFKVGMDFDPQVAVESHRGMVRDDPEEEEGGARRLQLKGNRKLLGDRQPKNRQQTRDRYLKDVGTTPLRIQTQEEANLSVVKPLNKNDRLLAAAPAPATAAPAAQPAKKTKTKPEDDTALASIKIPKKVPLVYSRELRNKYRLIEMDPPQDDRPNIYDIQQDPMDFDKARRLYDIDQGVNPTKYKLKFNIPEREFYLKLFSYRRPEKRSLKLVNFLSDFDARFRMEAATSLQTNYKIEFRNFLSKDPNQGVKNAVESLYQKK